MDTFINIVKTVGIFLVFCAVTFMIAHFMIGTGGLKRMFTLSGMYAVCKPGGYDVVCFSGKGNDGISCLPLSAVGGKCV